MMVAANFHPLQSKRFDLDCFSSHVRSDWCFPLLLLLLMSCCCCFYSYSKPNDWIYP